MKKASRLPHRTRTKQSARRSAAAAHRVSVGKSAPTVTAAPGEFNRSLIEASLDPFVAIGADGRITDLNVATEVATGCSRAELLGADFADYFTEPERARSAHQQAFAHGFIRDCTLELRHRDGHVTTVLYNAAVYRDAAGGIQGVFAAARDVTARKQAEEELRVAHQRLQQFVDANVVGVVIANTRGHIIAANDYYLRLIGYTREELIAGKVDWRALTPPEWLPFDEEALTALRAAGTCTPFEKEYLRRDGTRVAVFLAMAMLPGPDEQIAAFALDRTEQRKAEADLRAERKRLLDVLETLPAMICLLTPDYRVAFANRAFRERFGEAKGRRCYEYCFGYTAPCPFCESYQVLTNRRPHHWEVHTPDGRIIDAHDFPFVDVDGSVLVLEMDVDVTEQKQAQAALQQQNLELSRFNDLAVGRELRMVELKQQVNELARELGRAPPYDVSFGDAAEPQDPKGKP